MLLVTVFEARLHLPVTHLTHTRYRCLIAAGHHIWYLNHKNNIIATGPEGAEL